MIQITTEIGAFDAVDGVEFLVEEQCRERTCGFSRNKRFGTCDDAVVGSQGEPGDLNKGFMFSTEKGVFKLFIDN